MLDYVDGVKWKQTYLAFKDLSTLAKWLNQRNEDGKAKFSHIHAYANIYGYYDLYINGVIDIVKRVFYSSIIWKNQ